MTKAALPRDPGLPLGPSTIHPGGLGHRPDRATRLAIAARAVVLCVGLFAASGAWSWEYWIGRPTMADYIRHSVKNAVLSAHDYQQAVGNFQAEISRARNAYFSASGSARQAAGDEFGKLLFGKDYMLGINRIVGGDTEHTAAVNRLFTMLNQNQQIDGGIRRSAQPAFNAWILAMRQALGARGQQDMVLLTEAKLMSALESTQDVYAVYRKERDLAESRVWRAAHPAENEKQGRRPLRQAGATIPLMTALGPDRVRRPGMPAEVEAADKAGAQVLQCEYGPSFDEDGDETFGRYLFWKDRAPANVNRLIAYDWDGLGAFGLRDHAASACPKSEAQAVELARTPARVEITPALRQEVSAVREQHRQDELTRTTEARERQQRQQAEANARRQAEQAELTSRNMRAYTERKEREQREYQERLQRRSTERQTARQQDAPSGTSPLASSAAPGSSTPRAGPARNDYRRYSEEIKRCNEAYRATQSADRAAARAARQGCQKRASELAGLR